MAARLPAAALEGEAQLQLDRSQLEGTRIFAGTARLAFGDGRAVLDTLRLESSALDVSARGALGLRADVRDSVLFSGRADGLILACPLGLAVALGLRWAASRALPRPSRS